VSYWSHNPELLDEITTDSLPEEWKEKIERGDIELYDVPEEISEKAMLKGVEDFWASMADAVKLRAKEGGLWRRKSCLNQSSK